MTIIRHHLKRSHLRAALVLAAKQNIRYYLNGVLVELHPERAYIVGCDGHRLGVFRDVDGDRNDELAAMPGQCVEFIIPRDMLEKLKAARRSSLPVVLCTYDTETRDVSIAADGATMTAQAVEGKFPDWRRVLPAAATKPEHVGRAGQFNLDYLASFAKVADYLGAAHPETAPVIWHQGQDAAAISIPGYPDFRGVIMGLRTSAGEAAGRPEVAEWSARPADGVRA